MQAGNALHLPDTATTTKPTISEEYRVDIKINNWSLFILVVFASVGFVTISHYKDWETGFLLGWLDAIMMSFFSYLFYLSSFKYRHYFYYIINALALLGPIIYALYLHGHTPLGWSASLSCFLLLIRGSKLTITKKT